MKLLGIIDLAKRWNYTKQGVYQKIKQDKNFSKPVAIINKNTRVFLETDIIPYEQNKKELTDTNYKHCYTQKG